MFFTLLFCSVGLFASVTGEYVCATWKFEQANIGYQFIVVGIRAITTVRYTRLGVAEVDKLGPGEILTFDDTSTDIKIEVPEGCSFSGTANITDRCIFRVGDSQFGCGYGIRYIYDTMTYVRVVFILLTLIAVFVAVTVVHKLIVIGIKIKTCCCGTKLDHRFSDAQSVGGTGGSVKTGRRWRGLTSSVCSRRGEVDASVPPVPGVVHMGHGVDVGSGDMNDPEYAEAVHGGFATVNLGYDNSSRSSVWSGRMQASARNGSAFFAVLLSLSLASALIIGGGTGSVAQSGERSLSGAGMLHDVDPGRGDWRSLRGTTTIQLNDDCPLRIVGGTSAGQFSLEHMLQLRLWGVFKCGAIAYRSGVVITAAHCVRSGLADGLQVCNHRCYDVAAVRNAEPTASMAADISVLYVPLWTQTTCPYIAPITDSITLFNVSGWGLTTAGGQGSQNLLEVEIPRQVCDDAKADYVCAGAPGRDSCNGDSGGLLSSNGSLIGLVSRGPLDCGNGDPAYYISLHAHLDFIRAIFGGVELYYSDKLEPARTYSTILLPVDGYSDRWFGGKVSVPWVYRGSARVVPYTTANYNCDKVAVDSSGKVGCFEASTGCSPVTLMGMRQGSWAGDLFVNATGGRVIDASTIRSWSKWYVYCDGLSGIRPVWYGPVYEHRQNFYWVDEIPVNLSTVFSLNSRHPSAVDYDLVRCDNVDDLYDCHHSMVRFPEVEPCSSRVVYSGDGGKIVAYTECEDYKFRHRGSFLPCGYGVCVSHNGTVHGLSTSGTGEYEFELVLDMFSTPVNISGKPTTFSMYDGFDRILFSPRRSQLICDKIMRGFTYRGWNGINDTAVYAEVLRQKAPVWCDFGYSLSSMVVGSAYLYWYSRPRVDEPRTPLLLSGHPYDYPIVKPEFFLLLNQDKIVTTVSERTVVSRTLVMRNVSSDGRFNAAYRFVSKNRIMFNSLVAMTVLLGILFVLVSCLFCAKRRNIKSLKKDAAAFGLKAVAAAKNPLEQLSAFVRRRADGEVRFTSRATNKNGGLGGILLLAFVAVVGAQIDKVTVTDFGALVSNGFGSKFAGDLASSGCMYELGSLDCSVSVRVNGSYFSAPIGGVGVELFDLEGPECDDEECECSVSSVSLDVLPLLPGAVSSRRVACDGHETVVSVKIEAVTVDYLFEYIATYIGYRFVSDKRLSCSSVNPAELASQTFGGNYDKIVAPKSYCSLSGAHQGNFDCCSFLNTGTDVIATVLSPDVSEVYHRFRASREQVRLLVSQRAGNVVSAFHVSGAKEVDKASVVVNEVGSIPDEFEVYVHQTGSVVNVYIGGGVELYDTYGRFGDVSTSGFRANGEPKSINGPTLPVPTCHVDCPYCFLAIGDLNSLCSWEDRTPRASPGIATFPLDRVSGIEVPYRNLYFRNWTFGYGEVTGGLQPSFRATVQAMNQDSSVSIFMGGSLKVPAAEVEYAEAVVRGPTLRECHLVLNALTNSFCTIDIEVSQPVYVTFSMDRSVGFTDHVEILVPDTTRYMIPVVIEDFTATEFSVEMNLRDVLVASVHVKDFELVGFQEARQEFGTVVPSTIDYEARLAMDGTSQVVMGLLIAAIVVLSLILMVLLWRVYVRCKLARKYKIGMEKTRAEYGALNGCSALVFFALFLILCIFAVAVYGLIVLNEVVENVSPLGFLDSRTIVHRSSTLSCQMGKFGVGGVPVGNVTMDQCVAMLGHEVKAVTFGGLCFLHETKPMVVSELSYQFCRYKQVNSAPGFESAVWLLAMGLFVVAAVSGARNGLTQLDTLLGKPPPPLRRMFNSISFSEACAFKSWVPVLARAATADRCKPNVAHSYIEWMLDVVSDRRVLAYSIEHNGNEQIVMVSLVYRPVGNKRWGFSAVPPTHTKGADKMKCVMCDSCRIVPKKTPCELNPPPIHEVASGGASGKKSKKSGEKKLSQHLNELYTAKVGNGLTGMTTVAKMIEKQTGYNKDAFMDSESWEDAMSNVHADLVEPLAAKIEALEAGAGPSSKLE